MRRLTLPLLVLVLCAALVPALGFAIASRRSPRRTQPTKSAISGPASTRSVAAATTGAVAATARLTASLLPVLGGDGNVVFSPYSIETALAMVDQGAVGPTATQIGDVLGDPDATSLGLSNETLAGELSAAASGRHGAPGLESANGLWLQSGFPVQPLFTGTLTNAFGAAPQLVDFQAAPAAAAQQINDWVAQRTGGLIPTLMPASAITSQTTLVLVNALYLKALWAQPFSPSATRGRLFHPASGPAVRTPFMGETALLRTGNRDGARVVELPYAHSTLTLDAVMPRVGMLTRLERSLTPAGLHGLFTSLRSTEIALRIPRLDLSTLQSMNAVLSSLGMPLAFSNSADFSAISTAERLKIQAVEHAAVLRLDEAGTVAAAATGISMEPTAIALPSVSITLNRPFLLLLRDQRTGAILFAARVLDPAKN